MEVVLRGIDATFEKWEKRRVKTRRINGLAYCLQEVMAAFDEYKEALVGKGSPRHVPQHETLFSREELKSFFDACCASIDAAADALLKPVPATSGNESQLNVAKPDVLADDLKRVSESLANCGKEALETSEVATIDFEQLERRLSALEEKLLSAIKNSMDDRRLADLEGNADRELSPYRQNMRPEMIANLKRQFVNKRLLEEWSLPRLSLFHLQ